MASGEIRYRATLDARGFEQGARRVGRSSDGLGSKTRRLVGAMGDLANATGITVRDLTSAAGRMLEMGAAAEVTADSFRHTFGPSAEMLNEQLGEMANRVGLTTSEMQASLTPMGQMLQAIGFAAEESAEFSAEVFEVAAALAAFNPAVGGTQDALDSLGAVFRGEFDSAEKWGLAIKQADVNARALAQTGKELESELTRDELAMAALSLITEQAGDELDTLDENLDSSAAKLAEMRAKVDELQERMGLALLPVLEENSDELLELIDVVGQLAEDALPPLITLVGGLAEEFGDAYGQVRNIVGSASAVRQAFKDMAAGSLSFEDVLRKINSWLYSILRYIGRLPGGGSLFGDWAMPPSMRSGGGSASGPIVPRFDGGPGTVTPSGPSPRPGAFAGGGMVPGPRGVPQMAVVHGGERISGVGGRSAAGMAGGGGITINIETGIGDPQAIARQVVEALQLYEQSVGPIPLALGGI